jgi:hypothetical protein
MQITGEALEGSDGLRISIRRYGDDVKRCADVEPRRGEGGRK